MSAAPFADASLQLFGSTGVWCHSAAAATAMGDKDRAYAALTAALGAVEDLSVASPALAALAHLPLANEALDAAPGNVLRPVAHLWRGRHVLELGGGCGAVTRLLSEQAASVTVVEPSLAKATLARARTRDCLHVTVVCAEVESLPHTLHFDVVVALGSVDTAPAADALAWLGHARRWLRPTGTFLLGAHNSLLAPFAGPAAAAKVPLRLGLQSARELLQRVGLRGQRAYAVFPNLQACRTVLTQEGAGASAEALAPLLPELDLPPAPPQLLGAAEQWPARPHRRSPPRADGEQPAPAQPALPAHTLWAQDVRTLQRGAAAAAGDAALGPSLPPSPPAAAVAQAPQPAWWGHVLAHGLLLALAPAHLLVARAAPLAAGDDVLAHQGDLAYGYATWRPKQLSKQSTLRAADGHREVIRRRLYPQLRPNAGALVQRLDDEALPPGEVLASQLSRTLRTPGWSAASIARTLRPWADLLSRHERARGAAARGVVSGHLIDVAPSNVAVSQGHAEAFALEWDLGQDVPLTWVLVRGLCRAFAGQVQWAAPAAEEPLATLPLVQKVLGYWDVALPDEVASDLAEQERATFGPMAALPAAAPR